MFIIFLVAEIEINWKKKWKIFKIFDVLTGAQRVCRQNKNPTLSPTDFGMIQTSFVRNIFKFLLWCFLLKFMFSSLFNPARVFTEKLGVFSKLNYQITGLASSRFPRSKQRWQPSSSLPWRWTLRPDFGSSWSWQLK